MTDLRITEIRVQGMRTLADVTLKLDGLTVLIGDNGSGKSSLIELCEILRRAGGENFFEEFQKIHGGTAALLRVGGSEIKFAIRLQDHSSGDLEYRFTIREDGITSEWLGIVYPQDPEEDPEMHEPPVPVLIREGTKLEFLDDHAKDTWFDRRIDRQKLALTSFGSFVPHWMMHSMIEALRAIDVHLPFDTTARWAQRARGMSFSLRGASVIEPADALARFGNNLANAFHDLKNNFSEAHWQETMDFVRLGLGYDVESVNTRSDPAGGSISLRLKYAGLDQQVPAFSLSDGMLSYLCFVALTRLNTKKSLIAFDEPETHLHPDLLLRVLDFFEAMAQERPVLLATHSDRLLDGLFEPARSVVLCQLDERRATRLIRPDAKALADWLVDYRGIGDIRGAGHAASVLTQPEDR